MPRSVRHEYAGAVYHAMSRGNNGQDIFKNDNGRRLFLSTLEDVCLQTGWIIHAYVLMSNHYHLLFETPEPNLVAGMKWFLGTYTQRFNTMFDHRGHLFQGRYKALPVETSAEGYFREVGQYIHLNPFRAGLAGIGMSLPLEAYLWSSYPYYVDERSSPPEWLSRTRLYASFGIDVERLGHASAYRTILESRMLGEERYFSLEEREHVEKQLQRGWYIGSESFGVDLASRIVGASDNLRGAQRRAHDKAEAERIIASALSLLGIKESELLGMKSNSLEKQSIAWLLKKHTTATGVWIAARLEMGHRVNVSRAITVFDQESGSAISRMKEKMFQCTG